MPVSGRYNVFVGAETGLFKGVNTKKNAFHNFNSPSEQKKENEIVDLCWRDACEDLVYVGQKNQIIKLFDLSSNAFTKHIDISGGTASLRSIASWDKKIITADDSGLVKVWNDDGEPQEVVVNAGNNLHRMRQNSLKPQIIGTGGEENDLKTWDLDRPDQPVFKAKNVRNDFLDLRVPVWVTDMQFVPNSDKIITCTRHHQIRLYDPRSQRRPVIDMEFEQHPLVSLSLVHQEHQVIVGSSRGRMALIDLRKKLLVHAYKGFAGSIRCVQCHPTLPIVASCGLDRFLRIHDLNSRNLLNKIYLKSRLNCILLCTNFNIESEEAESDQMQSEIELKESTAMGDDELWDNMQLIKEKLKAKKRLRDCTSSLTGLRKKKKCDEQRNLADS